MSAEFRGYALLVGVGECEYAKLSLPVTVQDMVVVQKVLVEPGLCGYGAEQVRLLSNESATREGILEGLDWLKEQVGKDRQATAVVFYSGHGWRDDAGDYYLLPHDFDPMDPQDSAVSAVEFTQALRGIEAERLLVIVDCCHAAGMAAAKSPKLEAFQKGLVAPGKGLFGPLMERSGRAVFLSCAGEQSSWVRQDGTLSVFTFHLLEALQGAGSQSGDQVVTVSHLMKHLGRAVSATAREMGVAQDPQFSFETEDFAIALLQGGKGLPEGGWKAVEGEAIAGMQVQVQALGDRSVATAGNVNAPIVTGDGNEPMVTGDGNVVRNTNVTQQGKNNLNIESASGFHIGDIYTTVQPSKPEPLVPVKTILVLAANPMNLTRLALDKEVSEIEKSLRRSTNRDGFKLVSRLAIGPQDLRQALLEVEPEIIHFCGHGINGSDSSTVAGESDEDGIFLQDETGKAKLVTGKALTRLLSLFDDRLKCVILNSCYSSAQADLIKKHIPIVIGMKQAIGDKAAIEFSRGFYDALGAGRTVDQAFKFGCNAIDLENIPEHLTPVIRYRDREDEG